MKFFKREVDKSEDLSIEEQISLSYLKGYDDGISDGSYDARIGIAKLLLNTKLTKSEIAEITGISKEILKDLS